MNKIYVLLETLDVDYRKSTQCPYKIKIYNSYDRAVKAFHNGVNILLEEGCSFEKIEWPDNKTTRVVSKEIVSTYPDGWTRVDIHKTFQLNEYCTELEHGYLAYTFSCCDWNYLSRVKIVASYEKALEDYTIYCKYRADCPCYLPTRRDEHFYQVICSGHVQIDCIIVEF